MNQRLGETARQEIRAAMDGLTGSAAKAEATRLAGLFDVSISRIYSMTADLRQGKRKRRTDAGRRRFDLVPGTDTWEAATLVVGGKLDPDQALLTAQANGHTAVPTLATFQKLLRTSELNRKTLRSGRRNHRRFEAAAPLDIVQIDSSALKVRWLDYRTRRIKRIEGIDKNHPQMDSTMLRVWQIVAIDDHSRRRYVKYLAAHHITSADMVRFFCELCCEWGVPKMIYTDNGPEFHRFFAQAVKIIERLPAIVESGGFEHRTHAPGNAQASGKVEVAHQRVEKMNKFLGLAEQKGIDVTLEDLERFSATIDQHDNEKRVHRATGETPMARWFSTRITNRVFPQTIQNALLFSEAERTIATDMTILVDKVKYRLPVKHPTTGELSGLRSGMKISVIVPHELDEIFITLPDNSEIAVDKRQALVDVAGEYRSAAPSQGEVLTKALKEHHRDRNREAKEKRQVTGEVYQIPFLNRDVAAEDTNVRHFPHPEIAISAEDVAAATPVPMDAAAADSGSPPCLGGVAAASADGVVVSYIGKPVNFWAAVGEFHSRFPGTRDEQIDAAKAFLEESLFPGRNGERPVSEVEAAIDRHRNPNEEAERFRLVG